MARAKATTLILVTNTVAGRQWKRELLARTSLTEEEIGEYSGERKEIRPVTIATYQMMTTRRKGEYRHLELFDAADWGLIVYDEVHLLPAPIFRLTADLQSRRRLGLTATLVREDGREDDVFSLIGPKRYDAPWKDIEAQGYIAPADCTEVRVTLDRRRADDVRRRRAGGALPGRRHRADRSCRWSAGCVERHRDDQVLVIGAYLDQLDELGERAGRAGDPGLDDEQGAGAALRRRSAAARSRTLVVSKVANFSIDLPEAVGRRPGVRHLRLAAGGGAAARPGAAAEGRRAPAHFYTVVTRDTLDQEYAAHRQRFLAEQGYAYTIVDADDLLAAG